MRRPAKISGKKLNHSPYGNYVLSFLNPDFTKPTYLSANPLALALYADTLHYLTPISSKYSLKSPKKTFPLSVLHATGAP